MQRIRTVEAPTKRVDYMEGSPVASAKGDQEKIIVDESTKKDLDLVICL